jgi:hypothetical protein
LATEKISGTCRRAEIGASTNVAAQRQTIASRRARPGKGNGDRHPRDGSSRRLSRLQRIDVEGADGFVLDEIERLAGVSAVTRHDGGARIEVSEEAATAQVLRWPMRASPRSLAACDVHSAERAPRPRVAYSSVDVK